MNHIPGFPLSRRGLIRTGVGGTLAALGLGLGAQPASADVTPTQRFDLTQPSYDLFRSKNTHGPRVQQSFAFDWVNKFLFVATKRDGSPDSAGDLCINKMDFDGNFLSYMHLDGFGHGVAFAALPSGSGTELWIECAANTKGYGTALAPIRYTPNTTMGSPAAAAAYTPIAGATEYTCSVDPVHRRMIVRYHTSAGKRIAVYPLSAFETRSFGSPLVDFKQPAIPGTPQGYTLYGSYMYYLTGDPYPGDGTPSGDGNSYLTSIDINTGTVKQGPVLTKAGSTLHFREPEGLAIYRTDAGEARLFIGFATGLEGDRRSSIFYKNALV
ncbi:phage baseplate protein [Streptomyces antimicrobicus]|uniref:Teichoic acid biosynthesis protein C n=1 Tax=Streptomyces antimicrobicus TaxID=2883108 RepID=A0ABS8B054_9ACTN|nr:teichoic acid biosynthesis protein C [Streptomyces antimicrobicus]MCB5177982.1 teichoic acid biosynthesis protein C [Streptomyces antimicrobicus]